jgi:demethylmenaquinone methyltransferase/2-methoxy-6-polyprenyl-1,4-benzoquinol methylase
MTAEERPMTDVALGSGKMFDAIARRYDLVNRVISLGTDQGWRRKTVAALHIQKDDHILDLATGTADLALACAGAGARVTGVDPSAGMLAIGQRKVAEALLAERITLVRGDAQDLGGDAAVYDGACMAFGIRNIPDRPRALGELLRVVRPGGHIAILELTEPRVGIVGALARFHVHKIVPFVGALLSGAREYHYLQASIAAFPPPAEFAATMTATGLTGVEARPLTFGVATLFVARRP